MAIWKYKLDIAKEFQQALAEEITTIQLANVLKTRIAELNIKHDGELTDIVDNLEWFIEAGVDNTDEFDYILSDLYDWGDQTIAPYGTWPRHAMCWINAY